MWTITNPWIQLFSQRQVVVASDVIYGNWGETVAEVQFMKLRESDGCLADEKVDEATKHVECQALCNVCKPQRWSSLQRFMMVYGFWMRCRQQTCECFRIVVLAVRLLPGGLVLLTASEDRRGGVKGFQDPKWDRCLMTFFGCCCCFCCCWWCCCCCCCFENHLRFTWDWWLWFERMASPPTLWGLPGATRIWDRRDQTQVPMVPTFGVVLVNKRLLLNHPRNKKLAVRWFQLE